MIKLKSIIIGTLLTVLLATSHCGRNSGNRNSLQIKGSDTMVNLGQAWAEEFMKKNPGISIAVTGGGSGTGISALINNACDICEVSREMRDSEIKMAQKKGIEPFKIDVALDGLAVVVNPANTISRLTMEQLSDIFTGKVRNWKEVGGHDAAIVILSREVNSGTHVYFKEHVLRKGNASGTEEFASSALMMPSSQAIADEVSQNKDALGYYGMGYITAKQKALKIARNSSSPYVDPSIANVISKSYPVSRPLIMYTKGEPRDAVRQFIDFILSEDGQKIVKRLDFVPVK
ncbi:MAG: phosphate ABC transporter substrate-binding protein [bacterium]|nr:phosphate ABC transporter substrate-binding protein [bacterium]